MGEEPDHDGLRRLERKLGERKGAAPQVRHDGSSGSWSQGEVAWRMVIEMVAGLLLGAAIGHGLDWLIGTGPILLVVFTLFGFAAGIRTMLGTAAELRKAQEAAAARQAAGEGGAPDDGA